MRPILLTLALAMALGHASCSADDTTTKPRDGMKIRLKLEDRVITATLIDSKTTQDFISLLPLTVDGRWSRSEPMSQEFTTSVCSYPSPCTPHALVRHEHARPRSVAVSPANVRSGKLLKRLATGSRVSVVFTIGALSFTTSRATTSYDHRARNRCKCAVAQYRKQKSNNEYQRKSRRHHGGERSG